MAALKRLAPSAPLKKKHQRDKGQRWKRLPKLKDKWQQSTKADKPKKRQRQSHKNNDDKKPVHRARNLLLPRILRPLHQAQHIAAPNFADSFRRNTLVEQGGGNFR